MEGYAATSLRAIARDAGVDPALVHHYFDGKPGLFNAAVAEPAIAAVSASLSLDLDSPTLGHDIVKYYLEFWDTPEGTESYTALFRATCAEEGTELTDAYIRNSVARMVATRVATDQLENRAAILAALLSGLGYLRYVMRRPAIVAASPEDLAQVYAPQVERVLRDELPMAEFTAA